MPEPTGITFDEVSKAPAGISFEDQNEPASPPPIPEPRLKKTNLPTGVTFAKADPPTVGQRLVGRFMGTDVDDPLELPRMGAVATGAIAGGIIGSKVPVAPGPLGLVVNPITGTLFFGGVGALAGAVAPETALELSEALGVIPEGSREEVGLSPEDLRTVAEGEVLLDLATGGGITAIRLAGRGATKVFTGAGKAGKELGDAAARRNIMLMPVQVGGRTLARGYVTVMGRFPMVGAMLKKRGQLVEDAFKKAMTGLSSRVAPILGWNEVSLKIFKDANTLLGNTSKYFGKRYDDLFERAEEMGVVVIPDATLSKAGEILKKISAQTPKAVEGTVSPGKAISVVKDFIENEILPMRRAKPKTFDPVDTGILDQRGKEIFRTPAALPPGTAIQTLKQMDGVLSKIDQEIAGLEPGTRRFATKLLNQLRQAAQLDVVTNIKGVNADEIAAGLKELDTEFSQTMSQIFETSTAKRFATVQRRGLRGLARDEATRTPVDQLARVVAKLDSPQAMEELARLVEPGTFKEIVAQTIDDAVRGSMQGVEGAAKRFDIDVFAKQLGLEGASTNKRRALEVMLDQADSPLTVRDLDELVKIGAAIAEVEIPDVSTFIARKATIGGLKALINGLLPGLALASAGTYAGGSLLGVLAFVGGGKLISRVITNPLAARSLKTVLSKEATILVRRKAYVETIRLGLDSLRADGSIDVPTFTELTDIAKTVMRKMDQAIADIAGDFAEDISGALK